MIYFYSVRLCFYENQKKILCDYVVSFTDLIDFLVDYKCKNSSMEIYWIKPYYCSRKKL